MLKLLWAVSVILGFLALLFVVIAGIGRSAELPDAAELQSICSERRCGKALSTELKQKIRNGNLRWDELQKMVELINAGGDPLVFSKVEGAVSLNDLVAKLP